MSEKEDWTPDVSDPAFVAGYDYVQSNSDRSDGHSHSAPWWFGWFPRTAFWAGIKWEREQNLTGKLTDEITRLQSIIECDKQSREELHDRVMQSDVEIENLTANILQLKELYARKDTGNKCRKCKGTIYSNQSHFYDELNHYHAVCYVTQRAENAEAKVRELENLVTHCYIHSGYYDCGYALMDSNMQYLYDSISLNDLKRSSNPRVNPDRAPKIDSTVQPTKQKE